jgi:hypothetical protein
LGEKQGVATVYDRGSGSNGMTVGSVLSRGFGAIGAAPLVFFGTSFLLVALPSTLVGIASRAAMGPLVPGANPYAPIWFRSVVSGLIGAGLVWWVLYMAAQAVLFRATVSELDGRDETVGSHIAGAARSVMPLVVLSILLSLGVGVGWLLFIFPGIMLAMMWSVAAPALVAERCGIFASFGRSRELTSGARWRIFGLVVLVFAIYFAASGAIGIGNVAVNGVAGLANSAAAPSLVTTVMSVALQTAFVAIWTAIQGALYVELRDWKGGPAHGHLADIFA